MPDLGVNVKPVGLPFGKSKPFEKPTYFGEKGNHIEPYIAIPLG